MSRLIDKPWEKIFSDYNIDNHNFDREPFIITAKQIKKACQDFKKTGEKEVRILCKRDSRESLPNILIKNNLFFIQAPCPQFKLDNPIFYRGDYIYTIFFCFSTK